LLIFRARSDNNFLSGCSLQSVTGRQAAVTGFHQQRERATTTKGHNEEREAKKETDLTYLFIYLSQQDENFNGACVCV
jgi:hypothetical protein